MTTACVRVDPLRADGGSTTSCIIIELADESFSLCHLLSIIIIIIIIIIMQVPIIVNCVWLSLNRFQGHAVVRR